MSKDCVFNFACRVSEVLGTIDSQMFVERVQGIFRGIVRKLVEAEGS